MNIVTWLVLRYMDDGRAFLPPFKHGWRWVEGEVKFCERWRFEDKNLTSLEVTKRIIHGSLGQVEDYLSFTTETEEDFCPKGLPTLDTNLRVDSNNIVHYRFYEKPMNTNTTVRLESAMGENAKNQVLSNDLVRQLLNTSEREDLSVRLEIVDDYGRKQAGLSRATLEFSFILSFITQIIISIDIVG